MSLKFEDGMGYELQTPIGVVTIVCDSSAQIPLRIYGPDGVQVDPIDLARFETDDMYGGYLAFDMRKFSEKRPRRRRRRGDV